MQYRMIIKLSWQRTSDLPNPKEQIVKLLLPPYFPWELPHGICLDIVGRQGAGLKELLVWSNEETLGFFLKKRWWFKETEDQKSLTTPALYKQAPRHFGFPVTEAKETLKPIRCASQTFSANQDAKMHNKQCTLLCTDFILKLKCPPWRPGQDQGIWEQKPLSDKHFLMLQGFFTTRVITERCPQGKLKKSI